MSAEDNVETAFHEIPAEDFPFIMSFIREDTNEKIAWVAVTAPGATRIRGYGNEDFNVTVETMYANGKAYKITSEGRQFSTTLDAESIAAVKRICTAVDAGIIENGTLP